MCQERTVSTDMLPREHWSYDAMAHLAAQGFDEGTAASFYQGNFLLDELQMASRVRAILIDHDRLSLMTPKDITLVSRLAQEFRNQLLYLGVSEEDLAQASNSGEKNGIIFTGYVKPLLRIDHGNTSALGIFEANLIAPTGNHGVFVTTLTSSDREFRADAKGYPKLSKLIYTGYGRSWEWQAGRGYFSWGPGYSGSMILSDNAPAFDYMMFSKDFSLGRTLGKIKFSQVISPFEDAGKHYWFLGRRFQKTFSHRFNMGINETVKAGKRPRLTILVMPAFYLYQDIYLDDIDPEWNELISIDAAYRTKSGNEFYGEVVIDDITAPSVISAGGKRPRKAGLLLGGYLPDLTGNGKTSARAELIIVDPETYLATRPNYPDMGYQKDGQIIGHPVGNDAEALFLRLTHRPNDKLRIAADYIASRRKTTGAKGHAANLLLLYDVNDRLSTSIRWQEFLKSEDERVEIAASYTF